MAAVIFRNTCSGASASARDVQKPAIPHIKDNFLLDSRNASWSCQRRPRNRTLDQRHVYSFDTVLELKAAAMRFNQAA
jgi:hypothetical protein